MPETRSPDPHLKALQALTRQHARHPLWSVVAVMAGVVQTTCTIAVAALLAHIVHGLAITQASFGELNAVWWWMLPALLLRAMAALVREEAGLRMSQATRQSLRAALLDHLHTLGPAWASRQQAGGLASTMLEQVEALDGWVARYRPQQWLAVITPLMIVAAVLPWSWGAALILLITAPLIPLFMILVGWGARQRQTEQMLALQRMSGHFLELVRGLPTLHLLNAQHRMQAQVAEVAHAFRVRTMRVLRLAFLSGAVLEFFASVAIALSAVYFGMNLLGHLDFGLYGQRPTLQVALFVLLLAPEFYLPLRELGTHYHARAEALAAAGALQDWLRAASPQPDEGSLTPPPGPPSLALHDVSFAHREGEPVLRHCHLQVAPGEVVAIQGPSGGGKTTLLRLVLGQLAAQHGQVCVAGQPISSWRLSAWRQRVAWMTQHPRLLADTLATNLRVAEPEASDAALHDALQWAGLGDWFEQLPQGLNTRLGEGGRGMSGGQLRRLALARVRLRPADVLLLDEPTASLDADTERELIKRLATLCAGKTVLLLTHRSAPLQLAHRVLQLQHGQLQAWAPAAAAAQEMPHA
ncbi:thiol reductant ABC exporter subunit CydD [Aquabacterium sp. A3]|uniref:thiol reductant ABC exporter subunit CydD n=1 Tax=Aquabacterium sp. A3 TaxID=3132829 RepID=UPI0031198061